MKRSRFVTIALGLLAVAGAVVFAQAARTRSAHAQGTHVVHDFYGEYDQELTAVTPVPDGMVCGDGGLTMTVQTSEPPGGFTGACLMSRPYGGGLPGVCFSPSNATYTIADLGQTTPCTVPAANVVQPDWTVNADQGAHKVTRQPVARMRTLETCVPHLGAPDTNCNNVPANITWAGPSNPNGDCPCGTQLVSHSCCTQMGAAMQSDGQTASGAVYFH
jgi:hypothetical protein